MLRCWLAFLLLICSTMLPSSAWAQQERLELGLRLRDLEQSWEAQKDQALRAKAAEVLKQATFKFFAGQAGEAGRALDHARLVLQGKHALERADVVWPQAFLLRPEKLVLSPDDRKLAWQIELFYPEKACLAPQAQLEVALEDAQAKVLARCLVPLTETPGSGVLAWQNPLAEGDYRLRLCVHNPGVVCTRMSGISCLARFEPRLADLRTANASWPDQKLTTDQASVRRLLGILSLAEQQKPQEVHYPLAKLLKQAEEAVSAVRAEQSYFGKGKPGEYWLSFATAQGQLPARLYAPPQVADKKPLPLVIALHGAGGSDNMFFEVHGNGLAVRECAQRGWLLVAPRSGLRFGEAPLTALLEAVDKLYPVDKQRVFVVGHSMGAAQAVQSAGRWPDRFAGIAALGGGGSVSKEPGLAKVPFFVGVGQEDFALTGARGLHASLKKAEVARLELHEYPGIEHILVVQHALPEVFAFFEKQAKK